MLKSIVSACLVVIIATLSQSAFSQTRRATTTTTQKRETATRRSSTTVRRSAAVSSTRTTSPVSASQPRTGTTSRRVSTGTSGQSRVSTGTSGQSRVSTGTSQRRVTTGSAQRQVVTGASSRRVSTGTPSRQVSTGTQQRTATRQVVTGASSRRVSTGTPSRQVSAGTHRVARPLGGNSGNTAASSQVRRQGGTQSADVLRRNSNVTKGGLGPVNDRGGNVAGDRPAPSRIDNHNDFRIDDYNVHRIPPRDRDFVPYDRPGHFYGHKPHCFGYRVEVLPPHCRPVRYYGIDYYVYNDIYYRHFGGHYVVCRPPFGVVVGAAIADMAFAAVNFAYYTGVYRTYSTIDANYRYIDEQNRQIARNNAILMSQNRAIAMNPDAALSSYEIANRLGLVQSYAYADKEYYYEDGVFYIVNSSGKYEVIVPPAGALVASLPDDYDVVTLSGTSYYKVDDTVYRLTLVDGTPYLEVLGQMYGIFGR